MAQCERLSMLALTIRTLIAWLCARQAHDTRQYKLETALSRLQKLTDSTSFGSYEWRRVTLP